MSNDKSLAGIKLWLLESKLGDLKAVAGGDINRFNRMQDGKGGRSKQICFPGEFESDIVKHLGSADIEKFFPARFAAAEALAGQLEIGKTLADLG